MIMPTVVQNDEANRFEVRVGAHLAVLEYTLTKTGMIVFTHTEVPEPLEGQGLGATLAQAGLRHARDAGLTVMPLCPFVASYIRRHPEYQPLVMKGYRY